MLTSLHFSLQFDESPDLVIVDTRQLYTCKVGQSILVRFAPNEEFTLRAILVQPRTRTTTNARNLAHLYITMIDVIVFQEF